jgi:hypothetical protein
MASSKILQDKREEILRIAGAHGAQNVRVFGSVSRGEAGTESDVDLLVKLEPGRSLLDLIAIKQELEDLLGREVDVVGTWVKLHGQARVYSCRGGRNDTDWPVETGGTRSYGVSQDISV